MPYKPGSRERNYGYKPKPKGAKMENRERSRNEYHTWRWTKASRLFREANPFCKRCFDKGLFVPSEVTDHIIPPQIHGNFWDKSNWQPLCKKCNIEKGNQYKQLINAHRKTNQ